MAERPPILVAALSGRALAAAARRAGHRPLVADLFGDRDTRRLAARSAVIPGGLDVGFDEPALLKALDDLADGRDDGPPVLVLGAGFEDRPALLAGIARRFPLLGNGARQIEAVKDPARFFALLDRLGVPHPEVRFQPPAAPGGWLVKQTAASGGAHVRSARDGEAASAGRYFQRRVRGRPVSALFLADGGRTRTLGFSLQWPAPGGPRSPFRFGGAAQPAVLPPGLASRLEGAVRDIVAATGLRGLNSADFMVRGAAFDLLEINPRPGATLDIFDLDPEAPLFDLHCRACVGELPAAWQAPGRAAACRVVYARRALVVPPGFRWPRWSADRPAPGTGIGRGEPLCTVLARGRDAASARALAEERASDILARLALRHPARPGAAQREAAPCP